MHSEFPGNWHCLDLCVWGEGFGMVKPEGAEVDFDWNWLTCIRFARELLYLVPCTFLLLLPTMLLLTHGNRSSTQRVQILVAQCFSAILSTHLAVQHAACQRCLPHNSHTLKCNTWRRQRRRRRQQLLRFLRLSLVFLFFRIPFTRGAEGYYKFVANEKSIKRVGGMFGCLFVCMSVRLLVCLPAWLSVCSSV